MSQEHTNHIESATTDTEDSTWEFVEGSELAPGFFAWDLLGIGRRFEVWIAWCSDRLTPVCVKIPRSDEMNDRTIDALRREHAAASSFDHPAIPRVFAAELDAPIPYLVHEFVEGKPLSHVIDDDGPFDTTDTVFLGLQIAAALRHIHHRGFVHLDLKPSNIAMRGDRAMVIDFDIALPIGVQRSLTKPRGTRQYMAPEQIRCEPASEGMDLFALGAVLYEAATGKTAFKLHSKDGPSATDQRPTEFRQTGPPIAPTCNDAPQLAPSVATVIDRLITTCHRDDHPEGQRPETAEEVIRLLVASRPSQAEQLWPPWVNELIVGRSVRPRGTWPDR